MQLSRVEPGRGEPLVATLVEHQPGELGPLGVCGGDDLLRAGHLRHPVVAHERDRFDAREPRGSESRHELGTLRGRERLGLVLQAVARPDVADR